MEGLLLDLRHALRLLRRNPGLALAAVLSLTLGIGANATAFTFVKAVLMPPLAVQQPERLVSLFTLDARNPGYFPNSYLNYRDYRENNHVFSDVLLYLPVPVSIGSGAGAQRVVGEIVSGNYFSILGVRPALGRDFLPEEDRTPGSHPVAVISQGLWQRRYGADPHVIGTQVTLDGQPFTVVGVVPQSFTGLTVGLVPDVWVPMMMHAQVLSTFSEYVYQRRGLAFSAVGRLRPGVTLEQASAAMKTLAHGLEQEYPDANQGRTVALLPLLQARIDPNERGGFVVASGVLLFAVAFVLLIACVNLANVLLARALERRKEMALRVAVGATRGRLVRQVLTESLVLSLLGGGAGVLLANWATRALWALRPPGPMPIALDLSPDARVLGFTLAVSVVTGLLFGLAPALYAVRIDVVQALKDLVPSLPGVRGRFAVRNLVVIAQVAVSLVLLVSAALFARSLGRATNIDPGFRTDGVLVLSLETGLYGYGEAKARAFFQRVLARVAALPGVDAVALAQYAPLGGGQMRTVVAEGQENDDPRKGTLVLTNAVTPHFLDTLRVPLLRGRDLDERDRDHRPRVALVNETLARKLWPGDDPLGKHFRLWGEDSSIEVVGVARDAKYTSLGEAPKPYAYLALEQHQVPWVQLLVRTRDDGAALLATVRGEVQVLDPGLPVFDASTLAARLERALWLPRMGAAVLSFSGLLGLVLTSVGLYGVAANDVKRRTREVGIRLALGSTRGQAVGLLWRRGVILVAIGLGAGSVGALALAPLLSHLLYGSTGGEITPLVAAAVALAVVGWLATLIPARRVAGIEPVAALRQE